MEILQNQECMKCKMIKEKLYGVEAYIAFPIKVENQINQTKFVYDLNQRQTVVYAVCENCTNKEVKIGAIVDKSLGLLYSLLLLVAPVVYILDIVFELGPSGIDSPLLPILLFIVWVGVVFYIFRKQDVNKQKNNALNRLVYQRVNGDIASKRIFPEIINRRIKVQTWTEFTRLKKKYR